MGLFIWARVSELIKQAELFFYNKHWLRFLIVGVSFRVKDMGGRLQQHTGQETLSGEQLHLLFLSEELDQWVTGLDINMITASQAGSHTPSHRFYNAIQLLACAHRAFSRHDHYSKEVQEHLSCSDHLRKRLKCWPNCSWPKCRKKTGWEAIPGTVCL